MYSIENYDFVEKKVLVRVDFNVPLNDEFEITDDTRIRAALPTITKVLEKGSVILMSHLGRPKGKPDLRFSLKHIVSHLEALLGRKVEFAGDCIGESARKAAAELKPGNVLLLENLRFYKEEEEGNPDFAGKLAALGDVWINEAFGTAHRAHASTAVIARFFPEAKMFGYLMQREIDNIDRVVKNPERPFTAIMGGSKVSSKIDIIMNLMGKVDNLILGGGMIYTFKRALGGRIGNSICEEDKLDLALDIMGKAREYGVNLLLAEQTLAADAFDNSARTVLVSSMDIPDGWSGLDIGPESAEAFASVIEKSKTILWNGPVGVFEMPAFSGGTKSVAESIVKATDSGAFSLVGGGDSVAAVNLFGLADKVSYVSTGGGALLEYIEGKKLPGIVAIRGE